MASDAKRRRRRAWRARLRDAATNARYERWNTVTREREVEQYRAWVRTALSWMYATRSPVSLWRGIGSTENDRARIQRYRRARLLEQGIDRIEQRAEQLRCELLINGIAYGGHARFARSIRGTHKALFEWLRGATSDTPVVPFVTVVEGRYQYEQARSIEGAGDAIE